ncbi:MAG: glycosyltransferase [Phycisphaera sp.]|nr:MAG: glycosyltransferase [Phycisphaera sp.]
MTSPQTDHVTDKTPGRPVVEAVVPAWNRPGDLEALLGDLGRLDTSACDLRVLIVDNGSDIPLASVPAVRESAERSGLRITFHQLTTNRGGSGGFNAGIEQAINRSDPDFVWLVDSDVRLDPRVLAHLLSAIQNNESMVAVGPAIMDPQTGEVFECGGRIDRKTARLRAAMPNDEESEIDYVAACCALVRADAIRKTGKMPDTFIHSDDVMWCLALTHVTGGTIGTEPKARCAHPRFDRFKTWARYYEARNWVGVAQIAKTGPIARLKRTSREIALAIEQIMIGNDDLAQLHIRGLRDAAAGQLVGKPAPERTKCRRFWPWHSLDPALRAIMPSAPSSAAGIAEMHADAPVPRSQRPPIGKLLREVGLELKQRPPEPARSFKQAMRGFIRLVITPSNSFAFVHARAHPHAWAAGRILVCVSPQGYRIHRLRSLERLAALLGLVASSIRPLFMLTFSPPEAPPCEPVALPLSAPRPSLSIIILTRDRIDQLLHTLKMLREDETGKDCEIVVVDNASTDGTPTRLQREFPDVNVVPTGSNLGVEGFNRGVAASSGDAVLILDDDAWPDEDALTGVIDTLARRPDIAGVMMHRQHPRTGDHEWPFSRIDTRTPRWPDMGSGNVIRRSVWDEVGGYEQGYFLYRNDTDLALKLLAAGHEVVFTPEFKVWHDSPIAKTKTAKWLFRSTRNWVWLSKRHGKRGSGLAAILMGWLWAHKLAGLAPTKHFAALRGMLAGVFTRAPKLEKSVKPDGKALARLIRLKLGLR